MARLRELFPEAFSEGKTDLKILTQLLGDAVSDAPERYGLSWAGKSDAIRAIQVTSPGTLLPAREESVNFDTTENLIIEGDNLEVLKLLQGAYHGQVKMIYIDPPFNTGNEFIYPDNYKEGLADYLRFSGQVSREGIKLTTNAETDGRYHSKWLTMMYPRLFLARNLLREDGVIFVSIDDHEIHNLRAMMNEIFGEENFLIQLIWHRRQMADSRNEDRASTDHEYVVAYKRGEAALRGVDVDTSKYENPDADPRGAWFSADLTGLATKEQRPNLHYDLVNPGTGKAYPPSPTRGWSCSQETMARYLRENRILWPAKPEGRPRLKKFLSEVTNFQTGFSSMLQVGHTTEGTRIIQELFAEKVFPFSKPVSLMDELIKQGTTKDEAAIVLDFFGGSGTTAQAVLELNAEDGGNRKFILVQLPEPTDRKDFPTIAEITKERVRRVIKKIEADIAAKDAEGARKSANELPLHGVQGTGAPSQVKPDLGFKVFKLGSSNFKVWDTTSAPKEGGALAQQLKLMAHNIEEGRSAEEVLYELVLKSNLPLTSRIQSGKICGQTFYDVAGGTLAICLERPIQQETLRGLVARKPKGVICLDVAFVGNDQLKANTVLEMKSHGIEFHTA